MSQESRAALIDMMNIIRPGVTSKILIPGGCFPSYDPHAGMDVGEWVGLIFRTRLGCKLGDREVRLEAASVLKRTAGVWADECLLGAITWKRMKDDMLRAFEPETRYFLDVLIFRKYSVDDASNVAEYISAVWWMFIRIVGPGPTEQDAVEFVIGGITDDTPRTELLNAKYTLPALIAVAKTMRKRRAEAAGEYVANEKIGAGNDNRREQGLKCFVCGGLGHRARWCNRNAIAK